jgi:hypothetical protein
MTGEKFSLKEYENSDVTLPLQQFSQVLKTLEMFHLKQWGTMGIFSISKLPYLQTFPKVPCALLLNKKIFKSVREAQAR